MIDLDNSYEYSEMRHIRFDMVTGFEIYPNPTTDYFLVVLPDESTYDKLLLQNSQGVLLQEIILTESTTRVWLSDLEAGVYFVSLRSKSGVQRDPKRLAVVK